MTNRASTDAAAYAADSGMYVQHTWHSTDISCGYRNELVDGWRQHTRMHSRISFVIATDLPVSHAAQADMACPASILEKGDVMDSQCAPHKTVVIHFAGSQVVLLRCTTADAERSI